MTCRVRPHITIPDWDMPKWAVPLLRRSGAETRCLRCGWWGFAGAWRTVPVSQLSRRVHRHLRKIVKDAGHEHTPAGEPAAPRHGFLAPQVGEKNGDA